MVEKNGFTKEGVHRKGHKFRDNTLGDSVAYAILKEDYIKWHFWILWHNLLYNLSGFG